MKDGLKSAGDSIENIISKYRNSVYGLALVRTGSKADAEDVFQEVFMAYFQSNKVFKDEEHRKAWLLHTTVNMSRRITSSTWRKKTVPLSESEEKMQSEVGKLFQAQVEHDIWNAVLKLPETYRLPIYLFYFQELSIKEIGKALSIREGAVKVRLCRGREILRDLLKGGDYFEE